jgi:hypothetical protein
MRPWVFGMLFSSLILSTNAHALTCVVGSEGAWARTEKNAFAYWLKPGTRLKAQRHNANYYSYKAKDGRTYYIERDPSMKYFQCAQF